MVKRVVSYSLYGTNPLYIQGAIRNVRLVPKIYPGWTPRVYVSQEIDTRAIDELLAAGAQVIRKHRSGLIDGMFWRFLPVGDPTLDAVIIRDTDSRPTLRFQYYRTAYFGCAGARPVPSVAIFALFPVQVRFRRVQHVPQPL